MYPAADSSACQVLEVSVASNDSWKAPVCVQLHDQRTVLQRIVFRPADGLAHVESDTLSHLPEERSYLPHYRCIPRVPMRAAGQAWSAVGRALLRFHPTERCTRTWRTASTSMPSTLRPGQ